MRAMWHKVDAGKKFLRALYAGIIALSLSILLFGQALAESQGRLGRTSTATSRITLTIPRFMNVKDVADIQFGTQQQAAQSFCILSNATKGADLRYSVLAESSTGNFSLRSHDNLERATGAVQPLAFTATWRDRDGRRTQLQHGKPANNLRSSFRAKGCRTAADHNAGLDVQLSDRRAFLTGATRQTAVLTLVVSPE